MPPNPTTYVFGEKKDEVLLGGSQTNSQPDKWSEVGEVFSSSRGSHSPPSTSSQSRVSGLVLSGLITSPLGCFSYDLLTPASPMSRQDHTPGPIRRLTSSNCTFEGMYQTFTHKASGPSLAGDAEHPRYSYVILKTTADIHTDAETLTGALGRFDGKWTKYLTNRSAASLNT